MEEECGNVSNSSANVCPGQSLTAYIFVEVMAFTAVAIFNGLIATVLLLSKSVALPVRALLTNSLVANIASAVVVLSCMVYALALSFNNTIEPSLPFCRFVIWAVFVTRESARTGLAAFSVIVIQIIMCTTRQPGKNCMTCSLLTVWVTAIISMVGILVPPLTELQYLEGVVCFIGEGYSETEIIRSTYLALWFVIGFSVTLLMFICVPLGTLCYFRQHADSEGIQYKKAMAKFTAFLLVGNVLDIIGLVVIAVTVSNVSSALAVGLFVIGIYLPLAHIQTPILITVFLKPVSQQLRCLFCSMCKTNSGSEPMQPENSPMQ